MATKPTELREGQGHVQQLVHRVSQSKAQKEHWVLPAANETPLQLYTKRIGFNNITIREGTTKKGPIAFYVDVKAKAAGWNIFIHRGADRAGPCIMHLGKRARVWDKNTQMVITDMQRPPQGLNTVLNHPHLCTSNVNNFEYMGRKYEWYYMRMFGAFYVCYDVETRDIVALVKLKIQLTAIVQICTAWGLRINGPIEIYEKGKHMADIIIATMMAELEWRKHQNKWFNGLFFLVTLPLPV
ncbi:hypothetical protein WJX84_004042 [Apatococcus fuscideae]|uniref:Uncharacterized protein n=1 Tax=Apatococcus fuscideae TaxID=2026836 RepID=A0AAW1T0N3_9CHLO